VLRLRRRRLLRKRQRASLRLRLRLRQHSKEPSALGHQLSVMGTADRDRNRTI
jgi:hypothetical protein